MPGLETRPSDAAQDTLFGALAAHAALPHAVQTLEDDELRLLLVALLTEWRARRRL